MKTDAVRLLALSMTIRARMYVAGAAGNERRCANLYEARKYGTSMRATHVMMLSGGGGAGGAAALDKH